MKSIIIKIFILIGYVFYMGFLKLSGLTEDEINIILKKLFKLDDEKEQ